MDQPVTISIEDARAILRYGIGYGSGINVRLSDAIANALDHVANPNDGTDDRTPAKPDCSDFDCPPAEHDPNCPDPGYRFSAAYRYIRDHR